MFGLLTRLAIVASIPVFSFIRKANAGIYEQAMANHQDELILILCGILMVIGCLASIVTPDPEGVAQTKPIHKLIYSLFGSISAFVYLVFYEKELSIVYALWVGGVSYVSPAIIPSLKALTFELLPTLHGVIKKFVQGFSGSGKGGQ